jgi:hypothetical protein
MKQVTATFKVNYKAPKKIDGFYRNVDVEAYGKIIFKNDKLSISIENRNYLPLVSIVEDIVRKEFSNYKTSEIFSNIAEVSDTLVYDLKIATQELKADYIQKVIDSANEMHNDAVKKLSNAQNVSSEAFKTWRADWNNNTLRKKANEAEKIVSKLNSIASVPLDKYIAKEVNYGELHYENSLLKLADRLISKGISENFTIKSGYVDVNFEVVITHELGQVKAWTIIACGEIVRPHYRYLVK